MHTLISTSDALVAALQVVGTMAFAVSGATAASRRGMDWFGVVVLGVIVAIGGGTLRDVLLGLPAFWVHTWWPVVLAVVVAGLTIPIAQRLGHGIDSWDVVLAADALGLAVFTVLGADRGLQAGAPPGVAIMLGVLTGIAGGIFRDVLCSRTPAVFTGQVYALAAAAGATGYALLLMADVHPLAALWIPIVSIFGLRMFALSRDWAVPTTGRRRP